MVVQVPKADCEVMLVDIVKSGHPDKFIGLFAENGKRQLGLLLVLEQGVLEVSVP